jgi:hypothetical protein
MKATYIEKEGTFTATIADCYLRIHDYLGPIHVVEFRVEADKALYCEVQRAPYRVFEDGEKPGTVLSRPPQPLFRAGEKLRLETKRIHTRNGRSFMSHRWFRQL